jgi:hypothetical protein
MDKGQIVEKVAAAIYADGNPEWAKTWKGESTEAKDRFRARAVVVLDAMGWVPECKSWMGHKFEGRFSYESPGDLKLDGFRGTSAQYKTMVRALQNETYERDICVRCGYVIEKAAK